uniref:Uncharacterized protein n=1 Tax=Panagrolaimus sp. ES5 TaxID=591445 RepID=A0AC34FHV9_9BILA
MALIFQFLWISFIFVQGFLAVAVLTLCKKKKATTPAPGSSVTPKLELDKPQDQTAEKPAPGGGGGGAVPVAAGGAAKSKTEKVAAEDTDLKSLPTNKNDPKPPANNNNEPAAAAPAAPAAPEEEVKPMSTIIQPGNDNKFISKGNGVFVDKDGNPISQLAQPPQKDDAPIG